MLIYWGGVNATPLQKEMLSSAILVLSVQPWLSASVVPTFEINDGSSAHLSLKGFLLFTLGWRRSPSSKEKGGSGAHDHSRHTCKISIHSKLPSRKITPKNQQFYLSIFYSSPSTQHATRHNFQSNHSNPCKLYQDDFHTTKPWALGGDLDGHHHGGEHFNPLLFHLYYHIHYSPYCQNTKL